MKIILFLAIVLGAMCDPFPTGGAVCKDNEECGVRQNARGIVEMILSFVIVWVLGAICLLLYLRTESSDTKCSSVLVWGTVYLICALCYLPVVLTLTNLEVDANGYDIY